MDPQTLAFITSFTLKMIDKFKHRNDVVTEEEIAAEANQHYTEFLAKNQQLQDETSAPKG